MNNLAASFAQHPGHAPFLLLPETFATTTSPGAPPVELPSSRAEFLETAHRWATNAYAQARSVRGDARTDGCDRACAAALCNLGDILAMMGKPDEARRQFSMARKISLRTGQKESAQLAWQRMKELDAGQQQAKE